MLDQNSVTQAQHNLWKAKYDAWQTYALAVGRNDRDIISNDFDKVNRTDHNNKVGHNNDTTHTNYTEHSNHSHHGRHSHSNEASDDTPTHNNDSGSGYTPSQHSNDSPSAHTNGFGHDNNSTSDSNHSNVSGREGHAERYSYSDRPSQHSNNSSVHSNSGGGTIRYASPSGSRTSRGHSDRPGNHMNNIPHSNSYTHANSTSHADWGFDHQNFIPTKAQAFGLEGNNAVVSGNLNIGLFSYDKNNDGFGSQNDYSKTIQFTVDLFNPVTNTWTNICYQNTSTVYCFDTSGLPDSEGYILKVSVKNPSVDINGRHEDFQGPTNEFTFEIKRNTSPSIAVTDAYDPEGNNNNCFINFTFDSIGVLTNTGIFKSYEKNVFSGATPSPDTSQREGLFVTVVMEDPDHKSTSSSGYSTSDNWQKGSITLKGSNSQLEVPITWENGSNIISAGINSNGTPRLVKGFAYIPFADMMSRIGYQRNVTVWTTVQDYTDSSCQEGTEAGSPVSQCVVSNFLPTTADSQRVMEINISKITNIANLTVESVKADTWNNNTVLPKGIKVLTDQDGNAVNKENDDNTSYVRYSNGTPTGNPIKLGYGVQSGITSIGRDIKSVYAKVKYYYCPDKTNLDNCSDVSGLFGYKGDDEMFHPLNQLFTTQNASGSGQIINFTDMGIQDGETAKSSEKKWEAFQVNPPQVYKSNLNNKVKTGLLKVRYEMHYINTKNEDIYYATRTAYIIDISNSVLSDLQPENR